MRRDAEFRGRYFPVRRRARSRSGSTRSGRSRTRTWSSRTTATTCTRTTAPRRADLEHVPRPLILEYEIPKWDGDLGRRTSSSARRATRRAEGRGSARRSEPARQALVHRGDVPRADAPARDRVQGSERVRGGVPLPEARARMSVLAGRRPRGRLRGPRLHRRSAPAGELEPAGRASAARHRRRRVPRLLPRPGGAALERERRAADRIRRHRLRQLRPRRPGWLDRRCADATDLTLVEHDITAAAARRARRLRLHHPRGRRSRRRPTTGSYPIETMDANVDGLRSLLDYARAQRERGGSGRGLPVLLEQRDLRRPAPEHIPTPRLPRQRVVHRPAGVLRRVEALRRDPVRQLRRAARRAGQIARPFNNYGPGLKITDRRVIPDFARDVLAGRDIVMLSDGSPTRTFCYVADAVVGYYKVLVRRPTGRGLQHRRRDAGDLDGRARRAGRRARHGAVRLRGPGRPRHERRRGLPRRQPEPALPVIDKARAELGLRPAIVDLTRGCGAR